MKAIDLYTRVLETTGIESITLTSLNTAIANCMADLTSRGYATFKEQNIPIKGTYLHMEVFQKPSRIRKILYCRIYLADRAIVATRYALGDKRVECRYSDGAFRNSLENNDAIFYIKGDNMCVEWKAGLGNASQISIGYYESLSSPNLLIAEKDMSKLRTIDIAIREEFEDALVFYSAYFYYTKYNKDIEKISMYLSNYKYFVEDLNYELGHEDNYLEDDSIIRYE